MSGVEVTPVACESLGVRSMCTFIKTRDVGVLIDPGVALGPRFSLLPHPLEYKTREKARREVVERARSADLLVITHYHYDHYTPGFTDATWTGASADCAGQIYQGKRVLVKDFKSTVNLSQRRRGWLANRFIAKHAQRVEPADGRKFEFGETEVAFSQPVPHGEEGGELGWVLMVKVSCGGESVLFASDVQGPSSASTVKTLLAQEPDTLIIGGPPLYLKGFRVSEAAIQMAQENLIKLSAEVETVVVDHHLLRSEEWGSFLQPVVASARKSGHRVLTVAEFLQRSNDVLEFRRRELYELDPPSKEFMKWTKLPREKRGAAPPPLT